MRYDAKGGMHVAWLVAPAGQIRFALRYSYTPQGADSFGPPVTVHEFRVPTSSTVSGPTLALDSERAYVAWAEQARSGQSAGQIDALYISFPYGTEQLVTKDSALQFPYSYTLNYATPTGPLQSGGRAQLDEQEGRGTAALIDLYGSTGLAGETVMAVRSRLPYLRSKLVPQVGLVYLQAGENAGAQLLSFTTTTSERPAVHSDANNNMHVTWLEGERSGGFLVYYAGTDPALVAASNELTSEDIGNLTFETIFGLVSGLLLIPFVIAWGLVPTLFIFFSSAFRRDGEPFTARGTLLTVALAFALYWASKLLIMPGILEYVPFSAWLPIISPGLGQVLRFGVPLLVSAFALGFAWHMTYRRERNSPLFFLLTFVAVDGMISIAIYGVIFYGAV
jgi:hypothetical protein